MTAQGQSSGADVLRIEPSPRPGEQAPTLRLNEGLVERAELVDPRFDDQLFPFSTRGVWGMANRRGQVVVYPEWDWADYVYEGVHRVVLDEWTYLLRTSGSAFSVYRYGSIENEQEAVGFGYADRFSEGAIVVSAGDRFRLLDKAGRWLGEAEADLILRMSDGMAAAWKDGRAGYLDRSGAWRIEPRFAVARRFHDGLAAVRLPGDAPDAIGPWAFVDRRGEPRFVDHARRIDRLGDFHDGLARVRIGARWGYLDRTFELAIEAKYLDARPFAGGRAAVRDERGWFLIDRRGRADSADRVDDLFPLRDEARAALAERDGRFGWVGASQRWLVEPAYPWAYAEFRKLIRAGLESPVGDFLYVDITGRVVFDPRRLDAGLIDRRAGSVLQSRVTGKRLLPADIGRPTPRQPQIPPYPPEFLEDLQLPQPMLFRPDPVRRLLG